MREIKFKAWDNEAMRMVTENELGEYIWVFQNGQIKILAECETAREQGGETVFINDWQPIDAIIMQFTGLHDKNGKEIYEGDICKCKYYKHAEKDLVLTQKVVYENACFYVVVGDLTPDLETETYTNCPLNWVGVIEIIGNRFENPELL